MNRHRFMADRLLFRAGLLVLLCLFAAMPASAQVRITRQADRVAVEIGGKPYAEFIFADTKEGTFGIRLATPLSEARTGKMVNAEGQETEKNVWGKRSPWVDYYGQLEGQTVGVAVFDHPSNRTLWEKEPHAKP